MIVIEAGRCPYSREPFCCHLALSFLPSLSTTLHGFGAWLRDLSAVARGPIASADDSAFKNIRGNAAERSHARRHRSAPRFGRITQGFAPSSIAHPSQAHRKRLTLRLAADNASAKGPIWLPHLTTTVDWFVTEAKRELTNKLAFALASAREGQFLFLQYPMSEQSAL